MESLRVDVTDIYSNHLSVKKPMIITPEEQQSFYNAHICHICDEAVSCDDKVRDHCHLTGKYRGAAHSKCNLEYQVPTFVPIFLHNFSGYDSHFIIQELACFEGDTKCVPINKEKFISFSKIIRVDNNPSSNKRNEQPVELRFLDSFRFMGKGLDSLSKSFDKSRFFELRIMFPNNDQFNLLKRKGVFPYEYVESIDILKQTSLPPKYSFFSHITNQNITDKDYEYAKKVWDAFQCKTLEDYMNIYLTADVMLLTDIFVICDFR